MLKKMIPLLSSTPKDPNQEGPDVLLKQATLKKRNGELSEAITLLRQAYRLIGSGNVIYSVETFLRLPLYLQAAGRTDEAWREFNNLLVHGYPNEMADGQIKPMNHSIIYDKMRVFFQRTGKYDQAVAFGLCSYLSWAIGLHRQYREEELKGFSSKETVEEEVLKLLKKTGRLDLKEKLIELLREQIVSIPTVDIPEVLNKVQQLFK